MKSIPMFLMICLLSVGIFLIGTGCEQKSPPPDPKPSPEQQWKSRVDLLKSMDYNVLSVEESELWLIEHSSVTIDNRWFEDLGFLAQKRVENGSIITRDHNGNLRVAVRKSLPPVTSPPQPDPFAEWMTAEESKTWLRNNGYQVKKDSDGYMITYDFMRGYIHHKGSRSVSSSSMVVPGHPIPDGYVNIDRTGRLRVKVTSTQQ